MPTSRYPGVCYDSRNRKWRADLWLVETKKKRYLGYFSTELEAHEAYVKAYEETYPPRVEKVQTPEVIITPGLVRFWANGGFRSINEKHQSKMVMEDLEALQVDLFGS